MRIRTTLMVNVSHIKWWLLAAFLGGVAVGAVFQGFLWGD